jgi:putative sigma-54 modulation protein
MLMKVQVNAVHFTADASLIDFVQKKMQKVETFYDRITSGEVYLKLDKGDNNRFQKKFIEVKLNVPGSTLFVKEEGTTFEEATDIAMDVLARKVIRFKEKANGIKHDKPEIQAISNDDEFED